jgi:hypothetical protein
MSRQPSLAAVDLKGLWHDSVVPQRQLRGRYLSISGRNADRGKLALLTHLGSGVCIAAAETMMINCAGETPDSIALAAGQRLDHHIIGHFSRTVCSVSPERDPCLRNFPDADRHRDSSIRGPTDQWPIPG